MPVENQNLPHNIDLAGVIPAAGIASRLGPPPGSKELLPVALNIDTQSDQARPRAAIDYLLEKMRLASARKVYIILRDGKWDIPRYLGNGKSSHLPIAYLMMDLPFGVPFTIDQAYPFVQKSTVIFGFADILFEPQDAFIQLLDRQAQSGADVVLGLFESRQSQAEDLVAFGRKGRISKIEIKPAATNLKYTWLLAVWTNEFTRFLHDCVDQFKHSHRIDSIRNTRNDFREVFLGDIFNAAIEADLHINHVCFKGASYLDIGTPDNLKKASQWPID